MLAPALIVVATFLAVLPDLVTCYTVGTSVTCSSNSDCPSSTETYCYKVADICSKGYCACRSGRIYDSATTTCRQTVSLALGSPCSSAIIETYPYAAFCNVSVVACQSNYIQSGTVCQLVQPAVTFQGACSLAPLAINQTCNATAGLTCDAPTLKCICALTTSLFTSSKSLCITRFFGDACNTTANCDSGTYTNLLAASGGANCLSTSSTCGCADGFTSVGRLQYTESTRTTATATYCLKSFTSNLGINSTCTLQPQLTSTAGALICNPAFSCIRCLEDTISSDLGYCRSLSASSAATCATLQSSSLTSLPADTIFSAIKACNGQSVASADKQLLAIIPMMATLKLLIF